jgi:peptide/nickel transport system substrate-binding protein
VNWFSEPDSQKYTHNPDKAKQLLKDAGLKDPDGDGPTPAITLELKTSNNAEVVGIARIIQAQLAGIGIRVDVRSFEWGTFYGDIKAGNFQMTTMRWIGVTEPDFYYNIFNSNQFPPAGRNRGLYQNEKIDRLTEQGRIVLDPRERKKIYSKIQKIVAQDLPYVSLWHPNNISIVHKRVSGYRQHPMGGFLSFRKMDVKP